MRYNRHVAPIKSAQIIISLSSSPPTTAYKQRGLMRFNTFRLLSLTLATSLVILSISAALPAQADGDPVFVGAGDIAACGVPGAAETAALLDKIPGIVFAAGDNPYPDGTLDNFKQCL